MASPETVKVDTAVAEQATISSSLVLLMSASVGLVVSNIYYAQPLLVDIARSFGLSDTKLGAVAVITQAGAGIAQVIFVPLGDILERRRLITSMIAGAAVALLLTATAQNPLWLLIASLFVGMTASTNHIMIPFAAHLASPAQRGHVVGTVISGLLFGVVLARTFSGWVGAYLGWRAVFYIAAAMMILLSILLRRSLPESRPDANLHWVDLMRSVGTLWKTLPELREAALVSGMMFCVFNGFWTVLVFFVESPAYHFTSRGAGMFSLIGAGGALIAPWAGRLAGQRDPKFVVKGAVFTMMLAFVVMGVAGKTLIGLIAGVILLDCAMQVCHVSNQTRIYSLVPDARSRLNMVYMSAMFISASLGSYGCVHFWNAFGWWGVCGFALTILMLGSLAWMWISREARS